METETRKCTICRKRFVVNSKFHNQRACEDSICVMFYMRMHKQLMRHQPRASNYDVVTVPEWVDILIRYDHKCAYCPAKLDLTMDHVVPLSRGGRHTATNLVPACERCNRMKADMYLSEWKFRQAHPVYFDLIHKKQHRPLTQQTRRERLPKKTSVHFVLI